MRLDRNATGSPLGTLMTSTVPTTKAMAEVQPKKGEKGSNNVLTKAGQVDEQFCFEERASCCSRLTLGWFTTIILNSKKKVLEEEDIGTLNRCDECEYMHRRWYYGTMKLNAMDLKKHLCGKSIFVL